MPYADHVDTDTEYTTAGDPAPMLQIDEAPAEAAHEPPISRIYVPSADSPTGYRDHFVYRQAAARPEPQRRPISFNAPRSHRRSS